ncbi:tetratricopeptide repeat protein [Streptosporangium sp. NBC_01639]|uniref:AfsR/SARP family transcriptional regulator n=1 Tax=Streptosporangium sp. NBC_01639 TaxID=2975948 RepID=UPI00386A1F69|nr:tetratricopeptide repeat protein [Streptosporangium sp. NBC_01639]
MPVEFRLLGGVEVLLDGRHIEIGHARQRCVLAALLVEAGRCIPIDQLLDRVWADCSPRRGRETLYSYLSRLRRSLAATDGARIARRAGGYTIEVDPSTVDLHRFQDWVTQARTAADAATAQELLEKAVRLWRGEAFAGLDTPWLNAQRERLEQQRHTAESDLVDLYLRSGRHTELVATLSAHAALRPLDERLAAQLILALYRSGRQAEALQHYQRIRQCLAEELGTDPGAPLHTLYQQILASDPAITAPDSAPSMTGDHAVPVPRQLPSPPVRFTGRATELARLSGALDQSAGPGTDTAVFTIGGCGGVGKTWLALHWAYQNIDRFPDGQLFVNMRGFDPVEPPVSPFTVLTGFLEALGVPPEHMPADAGAQVGLYRSLMAGRRMLIVLDNVRNTSQADPLLPGSHTCTVVLTSRRQLVGMAANHGAIPTDLDVLDQVESRRLLVRRLGAERLDAEPEAVTDLLAYCGGMPLALAILTARATHAPQLSLAVLTAELEDVTARLDMLHSGDPSASVRTVFATSFQALTAEVAEVLSLMALTPGPDIGLEAAAALSALPVAQIRGLLRRLEESFLIHQHAAGRWRMHDLVRLHAAERAQRDLPVSGREAALRRLVGFYLHSAYNGERRLAPHRTPIEPTPPACGRQRILVLDQDSVWRWFTEEYACLLAAQHLAAERGWYDVVWQMAWSLDTFHFRRGTLHDQFAAWTAGLDAARRLDDPAVQMTAHRILGHACSRMDRSDEALEHFHQALTFAKNIGDLDAQAFIHQGLAVLWARQEEYRKALEHATHALRHYEALDDPLKTADAFNDVGWYAAQDGRFDEARAHCEAALTIFRHHRHHDGEANTLDSLGYVACRTGRHGEALNYYHQALTLIRTIGNAHDEAGILEHLGDVHAALGDERQAITTWSQAQQCYRTQRRHQDAERLGRRLSGGA